MGLLSCRPCQVQSTEEHDGNSYSKFYIYRTMLATITILHLHTFHCSLQLTGFCLNPNSTKLFYLSLFFVSLATRMIYLKSAFMASHRLCFGHPLSSISSFSSLTLLWCLCLFFNIYHDHLFFLILSLIDIFLASAVISSLLMGSSLTIPSFFLI